jgi:hypothetical protein
MKMHLKKIGRMASLTLAGMSVAVMLFFGGCASDTTQQSPSRPAGSSGAAPAPAGTSGAAPAPARPAGGAGGGGGPAD